MNGAELFERVVSLCGVSAVLAPGLVRRALADGRVQVDHASVADYKAALPRLLARMRAYMPEEEAQKHARRIAGLLAALELGRADADAEDPSLAGRISELLRTPASGTMRAPIASERGTPPATASEPAERRSAAPLEQDDDVTLFGRRWTADERKQIQAAGGVPASESEPAEGFRRTRR